ncbi:MAG: hypothetical protein ACJ8FK_19360, partial [Xanthobacteraceae bacterium]
LAESAQRSIVFRCPPELEGILPRPISAVRGLPDWFKTLPQKAFSQTADEDVYTIKKCPPVIDAMTYGFLMPLACDLKVENGEFSWERDLPAGIANYSRSPIDFHDSSQVAGTPFFDEDRFIIKFNNFWTIELPPGYSLLVMHPINRDDLPFTTLAGLVDADLYSLTFVHFPARWRDPDFNGTLPKGTPVAQCLPIRRESWTEEFETITGATAERFREIGNAVTAGMGLYRHQFRAPKR